MKRNALIIFLCVACSVACRNKKSPEANITAFLTDVKNPKLTFDEIYAKHVEFKVSRSEIDSSFQRMIENNLHQLTDDLNRGNVNISDLKITRYDKADPRLQRMVLFGTFKEKVYIIQGKGSFRRYILLNDDHQIRTWMTMKDDRVFILY